ncbi:ATP-binding protein [Pedobacter sp.]|uniref:tetratricopeptide repeat-containing sensor histidine kinase n=1 Tax=Pedobacter sp. TaxID=1411316 RepID=UPI00280AC99A|nr:ATP-binding protein [Pedobacter sp.]
MKSLLSLAFLLCIYSNFVWPQSSNPQKKIDSILELNVKHQIEDSLKLTRYNQLYRNYMRLNKATEVNIYIEKTIALAKKLNKPTFIADAYYRIGFYHHTFSRYFIAEEYYRKALEKFTELNDKEWIGGIYQNLSAMYANIPDYSKALDANFKAVDVFTEIKDVGSVGGCYVNISSVYTGLKQYHSAILYLDKALKIFKNIEGNEYGIALCYANLGDAYFSATDEDLKKLQVAKSENFDKALWNLDQAMKYAEKVDDNFSLKGSIYQTKGDIYKAIGNKELAKISYQKSVDYYANTTAKKEYASSVLSLANFYIAQDLYLEAEPLLKEVIEIGNQNKILSLQRDGYLALTTLDEKNGRFTDALKNFRSFISFKEQIFNQEKEKEITRKQMQLDFSVKEKDYQTKQQLTNLALDKQVLLVKERQQQLLLKQQQLALSDKEKNIQRLSFLQKQANLEREKIQRENQLKQQRLGAKLQKEQADQQLLIKENEIKLNRNFSIFFGVLAVVLLTASIYVYQAQRKTAKLNKLVLLQKEELESLAKVKDRIFSVVSHDMRTPVNSLISFINLLENGDVSEEKLKRYAANLKNSLGYTSAMMENLLNWAYSQMQGFKPNPVVINVANVVQSAVDALQAEAQQKRINISYQPISNYSAIADENMTSLIIRNILNNAIKFTDKEGIITIDLAEKADKVCVTISDTGIGMSATQIQAFNTDVNQLGETTLGTNKEKGTGLGLTLCKSFANLMTAKLTVTTNQPKGTIFTFCLPLV